jgi:bis(5'-nucleosyl)-tetraphosphatase (symmetrical)
VSDYAIGDIQGCYDALQRLLEHLNFNENTDRLWLVGDLINRGPQSLAVLRFIKNLPISPRITLGNHDLHFLSRLFVHNTVRQTDDTLQELLNADDREELGHWLRQQAILYHDETLNVVMCHAGIAPMWTLTQAKALAVELEQVLKGSNYLDFLTHMYGNKPNYWSDDLKGIERLRVICNYFTRMRFCDTAGHLILDYKGGINNAPSGLFPWYDVPLRQEIQTDIIFGHWAALQGQCSHERIHALDTGCVWGGELTALCLQDKRRYSVSGL